MSTTDHNPILQDDEGGRQYLESLSTAPLGAATSGRLIFTSGAIGVTVEDDPALVALYQARFVEHVPSVHLDRESAGVSVCKVTIHYRQRRMVDWLTRRRDPLATVALNSAIPWEIEFHGGVTNLQADLRKLRLRSLDLSDSSAVRLLLPQPTSTIYLYVSGSASDVVIQCPAGVARRVQIAGSASQVRIDEQLFGAIANGITWQTPDYHAGVGRYDIRFAGSASNVTIGSA